MPGEGHDLKEVISGQAQVIQDTMTKIVECEIFYACVAARRLEAAFDLIKGLSPSLKKTRSVWRPLGRLSRVALTFGWMGMFRGESVLVLSPANRMNPFFRSTSGQVRRAISEYLIPIK